MIEQTVEELTPLVGTYPACRALGVAPATMYRRRQPSRPRPRKPRSKPARALTVEDLGITKTHSRPYTSTDNPYSEAQFKTLKYRPDFPDRFDSILHARAWAQGFFAWYNQEHRHSGIGLMTPAVVHYARTDEARKQRSRVLADAYAAHPERFVCGLPQPPKLPTAAWINPPTTEENAH